MNILMANNYNYLRGGSEKVFFDEMDLLRSHQHNVTPFSINDNASIKKNGYNESFPNQRFGFRKVIDLFWNGDASGHMDNVLRKMDYEIFHGHNIHSRLSQSIAFKAKMHNLKTFITLHDFKYVCPHYTMLYKNDICEECKCGRYYNAVLKKCHKNGLLESFFVALELYFYEFIRVQELINCFFSPSYFLIDKYKDMGFKGNIEYVPNFIEIPNASKFEIYDKKDSYLYVGRLSYEKGIMTLLEAIKDMKCSLRIVGGGPMEQEIKEYINNVNLGERVSLLGHLTSDEVLQEMSRSKALVIPSQWYENAPITILEALALGVITIGANIGGIPEMIHEGENGYLFNPGDKNSLKEVIQKTESLSNNEVKNMSKYSKELVEEKFGKNIHYEKLIEAYEKY